MPAATHDAVAPLQHPPTPKRDAFIQAKRVEYSAIGHVVGAANPELPPDRNDELNRDACWEAVKVVEKARVEAAIEAGDAVTRPLHGPRAMQRLLTDEIRGLKADIAGTAGLNNKLDAVQVDVGQASAIGRPFIEPRDGVQAPRLCPEPPPLNLPSLMEKE
ncbi:hypothetical protein DFP72DRAFT_1054030 [Ephemerocybe angulata]|uniref:Uncharacterized protein n=1 Tax=Ephemerocybe angulata TaxID=980116 RepID=A0A8H6LSR5_9AGAR|nr:hypothetical protein DFP72DRAFT_1054030 [Tulosesus angulatus]